MYLYVIHRKYVCYVYIHLIYSCCKNIIPERLNENMKNAFQNFQFEELCSRFAKFRKL